MSRHDAELTHLLRQLKGAGRRQGAAQVAGRARAEEWSDEKFAATLLKTETDSRAGHGDQAQLSPQRPRPRPSAGPKTHPRPDRRARPRSAYGLRLRSTGDPTTPVAHISPGASGPQFNRP